MKKFFIFSLLVMGCAHCMAMANPEAKPEAKQPNGDISYAGTIDDPRADVMFMFTIGNGSVVLGGETLTIPAGGYSSNMLFSWNGVDWWNVRNASYTTTGGVSVGQYAQGFSITADGTLTVDMFPYHQTATFYFEVLE